MKKRPSFPRTLQACILLCWLIGLPFAFCAPDQYSVDTSILATFGLAVIGGILGCVVFTIIDPWPRKAS